MAGSMVQISMDSLMKFLGIGEIIFKVVHVQIHFKVEIGKKKCCVAASELSMQAFLY
jgi:hypothetical protein